MRRIIYVDPNPRAETRQRSGEGPPGFFRTILASLAVIPRNEPIADDLLGIEADLGPELRQGGAIGHVPPLREVRREQALLGVVAPPPRLRDLEQAVGVERVRDHDPVEPVVEADRAPIAEAFRARYAAFFGRPVEGAEIEFVTFSVKAQDVRPAGSREDLVLQGATVTTAQQRPVFDPAQGALCDTAIVSRDSLAAGQIGRAHV